MAEINHNRQIVLDTETTGMNMSGGAHYEGHRIIEIGAVEIINRRLTGNHFHVYLKPDRAVDPEAFAIHGISDAFLADKPTFKEIEKDFYSFIEQAELIIHNAPFDVGFINHEYALLDPVTPKKVATFCSVTDTLLMARRLFPGKRNNLDALCDRYQIDNSHRTLHGALLDAEILADVYLMMTGGQTSLSFFSESQENNGQTQKREVTRIVRSNSALKVVAVDEQEALEHQKMLELIAKKSKTVLWNN